MSPPLTKRPHWIPVVVGLIQKKGQILVGQRPEGSSLPGVWEFPGGKVELGEDPDQALIRELDEELGIAVNDPEIQFSVTHNYTETGILLIFYKVQYWTGEPKDLHHDNIKWVDAHELKALELPDANKKALHKIIGCIS